MNFALTFLSGIFMALDVTRLHQYNSQQKTNKHGYCVFVSANQETAHWSTESDEFWLLTFTSLSSTLMMMILEWFKVS